MAQLIREWVMSCEQCIRESRIDPSLTRPPLQNPNEHITAPEDAIQIDLVPGLPPSGGYENIVTAMDLFSRYLFAYPTSNQDANTIAKVLINIMTKQATYPRRSSQIKVQPLRHVYLKKWPASLALLESTPPPSTLKQLGYLSDLMRQSKKH